MVRIFGVISFVWELAFLALFRCFLRDLRGFEISKLLGSFGQGRNSKISEICSVEGGELVLCATPSLHLFVLFISFADYLRGGSAYTHRSFSLNSWSSYISDEQLAMPLIYQSL